MNNWIILAPLLLGVGLLLFGTWQLVKEIKPVFKQLKSLQSEMDRATQLVSATTPTIQSLVSEANEGMAHGKALVKEAKEAYWNVKAIMGALRDLDTLPARRAIAYLKEHRNNRRRRLQKKLKQLKEKAIEYKRELLD